MTLPYKLGEDVMTPRGVGRILHYADYKKNDFETQPHSVVILFGSQCEKYPLNQIQPNIKAVKEQPPVVQPALF